MKKIYISGINGFIGSQLRLYLSDKGYDVRGLNRNDFNLNDADFQHKIIDADIIINLVGAPINKRWSKKYKQELTDSRIKTTRKIAQAIISNIRKPELYISTSAIGIYNSKDQQDEDSEIIPSDFLGNLCFQWEAEALKVSQNTNVSIFRLGVVLSKNGGALKKMLIPFKLGLGGIIGSGNQSFSWIHIEDLLNAYLYIIDNNLNGIYNLTSPEPVNNKTLTKAIAKALRTKFFMHIPEFFFKILYGEGATVLIDGQYVLPKNLIKQGFNFRFSDIQSALKDLL